MNAWLKWPCPIWMISSLSKANWVIKEDISSSTKSRTSPVGRNLPEEWPTVMNQCRLQAAMPECSPMRLRQRSEVDIWRGVFGHIRFRNISQPSVPRMEKRSWLKQSLTAGFGPDVNPGLKKEGFRNLSDILWSVIISAAYIKRFFLAILSPETVSGTGMLLLCLSKKLRKQWCMMCPMRNCMEVSKPSASKSVKIPLLIMWIVSWMRLSCLRSITTSLPSRNGKPPPNITLRIMAC